MFKRVSCLIAALVVLASVIVIPTYASQSITVTADWPALTFTYVDDPDDPFEEFKAFASVNGSYVEFWTSESNDLIVIPDEYLVAGFSYVIRGSTALGTVLSSPPIIYYGAQHVLPDTCLDSHLRQLTWDLIQLPSTYSYVDLVTTYGNGSTITVRAFEKGEWVRSEFNFVNYLRFNQHLAAGTPMSSRLQAYNSSGTLIDQGRSISYFFEIPWLDFYWDFSDPMSPVRVGDSDFAQNLFPDTILKFYYADDDTYIGQLNTTVTGGLDRTDMGIFYQTNHVGQGNPVSGFVFPRSIKVVAVYAFRLTAPYISADFYLTGKTSYITGLDGFAIVDTGTVDNNLITLSPADLNEYVPLMYSGVTNTPIYKYVFSGLVLCLPFVAMVFLINKVH